ncbi:MAG: hypothetical protein QXS68_05355 [Candidatus Methanomethylicaceae archaeon]
MLRANLQEKHVFLNYVGHIAFMAGKTCESIPLGFPATVNSLLSELDHLYPGIRNMFFSADDSFAVARGIILRRKTSSISITDPEFELLPGDVVTLW